jgi:hypothetical protein
MHKELPKDPEFALMLFLRMMLHAPQEFPLHLSGAPIVVRGREFQDVSVSAPNRL